MQTKNAKFTIDTRPVHVCRCGFVAYVEEPHPECQRKAAEERRAYAKARYRLLKAGNPFHYQPAGV